MANEVSRVIYARAREAGRLHVDQIAAMFETQRQATASFEYVLLRRRGRTGLVLLDMDGTITPQRFARELARATDQEAALLSLLDTPAPDDSATRSERIAARFKFVHRRQFERVAHAMPLRPGVIDWVNRMRRAGFMVGLVSDSYFIAAEILRRRIFADFALAHTLQFNGDICTGELKLNPAFQPLRPSRGAPPDKGHVVRRFRRETAQTPWEAIWAVGDNDNDLGMLLEAAGSRVLRAGAWSFLHEDVPQWANGVAPSGDEFVPLWGSKLEAIAWQEHWPDAEVTQLGEDSLMSGGFLERGDPEALIEV
jgi:phosphoserine phosphatase